MRALASEERFSRGVDALKGIAILGIVFYHYYRRHSGIENNFQWQFGNLPTHPQEWGYLGVSLFFILSGWALTCAEEGREQPSAFHPFIVRRLRRIVPLYYFSIVAVFLGFWIFTVQEFSNLSWQFFLKIAFLQNVSPHSIFSYNSSWWFLGSLVFLYLLFPALLRGFRRFPDISLVLCLVLSFGLSHLLALAPIADWHPYLAMGGFPFVKLGEFGFGIWVAREGRCARAKWLAVTLCLATLGLGGLWSPALYPLHPIGIVAPLVFLAPYLSVPGMDQLGAYSYGLFLFHRPLIDPWLAWARRNGVPDSAWLGAAIFTILVWLPSVFLEKGSRHVFGRK